VAIDHESLQGFRVKDGSLETAKIDVIDPSKHSRPPVFPSRVPQPKFRQLSPRRSRASMMLMVIAII
jgi:hypothetical protein